MDNQPSNPAPAGANERARETAMWIEFAHVYSRLNHSQRASMHRRIGWVFLKDFIKQPQRKTGAVLWMTVKMIYRDYTAYYPFVLALALSLAVYALAVTGRGNPVILAMAGACVVAAAALQARRKPIEETER